MTITQGRSGDESPVYENFLLDAHAVEKGGSSLFITGDGCYRASAPISGLIAQLPRCGGRSDYHRALADLGAQDAEAIFQKLLANGTLRPQSRRPLHRRILTAAFSPKIRLIAPGIQDRVFRWIGLNDAGPAVGVFTMNAGLASVGILLAVISRYILPHPALAGRLHGALTIALALVGMMAHELGHSATAWALGIGARPVGFSMYLYCPVFYTNVSGIRSLDLKGQLAVSLGGFAAQTLFMAVLLTLFLATGSMACLQALHVLAVLLIFNLNPLLHTDGYWCYRDTHEHLRGYTGLNGLHAVYLAAFFAYTVYLVGRGGAFVGASIHRLMADGRLSQGNVCRLAFCGYLGVLLMQGIWERLKELRREGRHVARAA
jgi:Zn-dependent protease